MSFEITFIFWKPLPNGKESIVIKQQTNFDEATAVFIATIRLIERLKLSPNQVWRRVKDITSKRV